MWIRLNPKAKNPNKVIALALGSINLRNGSPDKETVVSLQVNETFRKIRPKEFEILLLILDNRNRGNRAATCRIKTPKFNDKTGEVVQPEPQPRDDDSAEQRIAKLNNGETCSVGRKDLTILDPELIPINFSRKIIFITLDDNGSFLIRINPESSVAKKNQEIYLIDIKKSNLDRISLEKTEKEIPPGSYEMNIYGTNGLPIAKCNVLIPTAKGKIFQS